MSQSYVPYDAACVDCRREAGKDPAGVTTQCIGHVYLERDALRQQLAATQRELARREGEILTIANGDRLHEDASENAHLAADYRDTLKRIGDNAKLERDEARRELEIRVAQVIEFRAEGDRMREERDRALALLRDAEPFVRHLHGVLSVRSPMHPAMREWLARLDAVLEKKP